VRILEDVSSEVGWRASPNRLERTGTRKCADLVLLEVIQPSVAVDQLCGAAQRPDYSGRSARS